MRRVETKNLRLSNYRRAMGPLMKGLDRHSGDDGEAAVRDRRKAHKRGQSKEW